MGDESADQHGLRREPLPVPGGKDIGASTLSPLNAHQDGTRTVGVGTCGRLARGVGVLSVGLHGLGILTFGMVTAGAVTLTDGSALRGAAVLSLTAGIAVAVEEETQRLVRVLLNVAGRT